MKRQKKSDGAFRNGKHQNYLEVMKQEVPGGSRSGTCDLRGLQPVLRDPARLSPGLQAHTPSSLAFRAEQKIKVKASELSCVPTATWNFITTSHSGAEPVGLRVSATGS